VRGYLSTISINWYRHNLNVDGMKDEAYTTHSPQRIGMDAELFGGFVER